MEKIKETVLTPNGKFSFIKVRYTRKESTTIALSLGMFGHLLRGVSQHLFYDKDIICQLRYFCLVPKPETEPGTFKSLV